jgi:hypothetical protein
MSLCKFSGLAALALALLPAVAAADSGCGLNEVMRYQAALHTPAEEATPQYRLRIAEGFIAQCPERLEARDAHVVAARGALDSGEPLRAARHYDRAISSGARLTPKIRLDEAVALAAIGQGLPSNAARNAAVADWLTDLQDRDLATLSVRRTRNGMIYGAEFHRRDPDMPVAAVWLAVPRGAGLPAAVIVRKDTQRAAWRALRTGRRPFDLSVIEHQTCRTQTLLRESLTDILPADAETLAVRALKIYLAAPETVAPVMAGQPVASCVRTDTLLHVPQD